jgi:diaminopimelate decarboxylase
MSLMKRENPESLPPHLAKYPTPFHVYYENRLKEDARAIKHGLRSRLPGAELYYSAKTNSLLALLRCLLSEGWKIETVCAGDRQQASLAGARGSQLLLNGAAWSKNDLEDALARQRIQHLTIDSPEMAKLLGSVLREHRHKISGLHLALRIHDGNSHFGFQAETTSIRTALSEIPIETIAELGLHLHSNPPASITSLEELRADFSGRTRQLLSAAEIVNAVSIKKQVGFFDLGGGIDSPYIYRPQPSELAEFHNPSRTQSFRQEKGKRHFLAVELAEAVSGAVADALGNSEMKIFFEPGRAVCSRALSTVIEVRSVKTKFYPEGDVVITDGNTAILGPLHRGIYPVELANREDEKNENTFVYGNLPHSGDWLFQSMPLPTLQPGDRLVIAYTGAYFLPLEANFGLPRPGIYSFDRDQMLRAPETELDPGIRDNV